MEAACGSRQRACKASAECSLHSAVKELQLGRSATCRRHRPSQREVATAPRGCPFWEHCFATGSCAYIRRSRQRSSDTSTTTLPDRCARLRLRSRRLSARYTAGIDKRLFYILSVSPALLRNASRLRLATSSRHLCFESTLSAQPAQVGESLSARRCCQSYHACLSPLTIHLHFVLTYKDTTSD